VVKKLTVLIPEDLHKKLKIKAAQEVTTVTELVIKALQKAV